MTTPATDEQIAELEAAFSNPPEETDPIDTRFAMKIGHMLLPAILARLRAAEAEAERIRAEERERLANLFQEMEMTRLSGVSAAAMIRNQNDAHLVD